MNEVDKGKVKVDYLSGMKQKDIIQKYNLPLITLKSWIKRYHWSEEKRVHPKIIEMQSEIMEEHHLKIVTQRSMVLFGNTFWKRPFLLLMK